MIAVGDSIEIISMEGEPQYTGCIGTVERIDDAGQLHGTWGGCAVIPCLDSFRVIGRKEVQYEQDKDGSESPI